MVTRSWKVYGLDGHKQRHSFFESYKWDFSEDNDVRIIEVLNSDKTGTNFENNRVGAVVEIFP